jgi:hypothetical protein
MLGHDAAAAASSSGMTFHCGGESCDLYHPERLAEWEDPEEALASAVAEATRLEEASGTSVSLSGRISQDPLPTATDVTVSLRVPSAGGEVMRSPGVFSRSRVRCRVSWGPSLANRDLFSATGM